MKYHIVIGNQQTPEKTLEEVGKFLLELAKLGFISIELKQVGENGK